MLLFLQYALWSIIGDLSFVVSSLMSSASAFLPFHLLTGKMGTRPMHDEFVAHDLDEQYRASDDIVRLGVRALVQQVFRSYAEINIFVHVGLHFGRWLLLDSRVVIGPFLRNRLFLQAFYEGRDRGGLFGKSRLIASAYVLSMLCKTPESNKSLRWNVDDSMA